MADAAPTTAVPPTAGARNEYRARLWRSARRNVFIRIGATVTALLVLASFLGPLVIRTDPTEMDMVAILQGPSRSHPFGTDDFGRDVLARVLAGTRVSILVGSMIAGVTLVAGLLIGLVSAFYSVADEILMRAMDVLMAFPAILLAIGILAILGPRLSNIIIALAIVYTPRSARVVRGVALSLKQEVYVDAARALGSPDWRLMIRHFVPNVLPPLIIQQTFIFALAVLAEAALNFLGVGVPPEVATLGGILSDARTNLRYAPWMSIFPGSVISLLVLGFNLLGDGLRDVLDPRMTT